MMAELAEVTRKAKVAHQPPAIVENPKQSLLPQALLDLEADKSDPYGPFVDIKKVYHPSSQSWKWGMQPHFNFLNIRTLPRNREGEKIALPLWFTGDFSWDKERRPVDPEPSGDTQSKLKANWKNVHVPGAKISIPLTPAGMTYSQLAAYCHYTSPGACAEWQHTDG
jgi:hypothetical protein